MTPRLWLLMAPLALLLAFSGVSTAAGSSA